MGLYTKNDSDDPISAIIRRHKPEDNESERYRATIADYAARRRARLYLKAVEYNTTVDRIKSMEPVYGF